MSLDLDEEPTTRPHGTLSFTKSAEELRDPTHEQLLASWRSLPPLDNIVSRPSSLDDLLTIFVSESQPGLNINIVCAKVVKEAAKKHVAYYLKICKNGSSVDPKPVSIKRRYSDFRELYLFLKQEHARTMAKVAFPRKVMIGNFGKNLIAERKNGFELMLNYITAHHRLYESPSFAYFLQGIEQREARKFMCIKRYDLAVPILENCFRLLNKVYTDRHPFVITSLCRLVACCAADTVGEEQHEDRALRFAELALRRYEAVSDADLLRYYVPLLQLAVRLRRDRGLESPEYVARLGDFKRRGMRVDNAPALLDAVMEVPPVLCRLY